MSNFLNKNLVINFFIILVIFGLDRITKLYVISESEKNLSSELFVSKYLNVNLIWNEGIAFGLLAFSSSNIYNFVTIIIFVVILMVIYFIIKSEKMDKIFFLMIFSGATGNFYDRIVYKAVPDFIDLHINNLHWFIFNIADIFITLGVVCLILKETILRKK